VRITILSLSALVLVACQSDQEKADEAITAAVALLDTQPEQARAKLEEATLLDPTRGDAFAHLARLHFEAERFDEARDATRQAIDAGRGDAGLRVLLARSLLGAGDFEEAVTALEAARRESDDPSLAFALAQAYQGAERADDAVTAYQEAIAAGHEVSHARIEVVALRLPELETQTEAAMARLDGDEDGEAEDGDGEEGEEGEDGEAGEAADARRFGVRGREDATLDGHPREIPPLEPGIVTLERDLRGHLTHLGEAELVEALTTRRDALQARFDAVETKLADYRRQRAARQSIRSVAAALDRQIAESAGILGALRDGGSMGSIFDSSLDLGEGLSGSDVAGLMGDLPFEGGGLAARGAGGGVASVGLGGLRTRGTGGGGGEGFGRIAGMTESVSVRIGDVRGSGGVDAEVVRRVVRARLHPVRYCYERARASDDSLEGRVTVDIAIDATGRVTSANARGVASAVSDCVARQAHRWRFPADQAGSATLTYEMSAG